MANIQRRFLKARTFVLIVTGVWMTSEVFAQTTYVESWGNDIYGQCDTPAGLSNVLAVAGGNDFSLALKSDHTVVAWGNNNMGQCNLPAGLSNVTAIAAAMGSFGLALKSDGTVVGWGSNGLGQVTIPAGLSNVVAIAAGNVQSLAVKSDGTVVAWGGNSFGETNVPAGLSNVIAVCGYQNSMALKSDGSIMAWGFNGRGENNIPGGLGPVTAIATRQHTLVLKQDGTVAAWGLNDWGEATVPGGVGNVVAIGAGYSHNLVLESNGTLVAWGYNANGQGSVPAGLTGVSAIGVGGNHNLVVTTVPLIKISAQPQSMLTNVGAAVTFQISATCQLPLSYQWQKNGTNLSGATTSALSIPTTQASDAGNYAMVLSHPTATVTSSIATLSFTPPKIITQPKNAVVQVGNSVSFSVSATGSLPLNYQWRKNGTDLAGQTATNLVIAGVQQSDAGTYAVFVSNGFGSVTSAPAVLSIFQSQQNAVSPPSTVVSLGGPTPPAGLNDVIAIAAGFGQQLAVHSNGTVTCWGSTFLGSSPQPPAGLSNVVAVASCGIHSIALKSDGTVVGWGQSSTPPAGLSNVVAISSGHDHSVALKADGTAVAWGGVSVGPPLHNSNLVAIAAGNSYTIGLCNDGTVPPSTSTLAGFTGASNMTAIAGGGFNSFLMLSNNGTVVGWNVTIPAGLSNVVALSPGLALKSDSTVVALGSATSSVSMTNVTAISGGVGNGLVLTRWPVVIQPPQSQTVNAGTNAFFTVTAAGAGSLSYQWRKAGTNIDGATASSLSISNVTAADASSYDVLVSNSNGSVASVPATLTVNLAPIITAPPQSQTVRAGMRVDFTVSATGGQPFSYQWRHNGTDMSGASAATFSLGNAHFTDAGNYAVVVTNGYGSVTSSPAALTVLSNTFVLPSPGTVVGLGYAVPDGLTNVIAIAAGFGQQLAVRSDGTVVCWGSTFLPPNPQPPTDLSNVVAVSSGGIHSMALKSDGTVVGWGHDATPPAGLFGVIAISSGHDHTVALKADGTAVAWGGVPVGPPVYNSNLVAVAAGNSYSLGLRNDGVVPPSTSTLAGFTGASNVMAIAGGGFNSFPMLRNDGTVSGWNLSVPAGLSNVIAISQGLALKNDGTVVALGGSTVPPGLTNVAAVSGSVGNGLVLTTNPPPPIIAGVGGGGSFMLSTPLSVPGYVLEASENPTGPFTVVETYTNAVNTNALVLPAASPGQYYRLRKR